MAWWVQPDDGAAFSTNVVVLTLSPFRFPFAPYLLWRVMGHEELVPTEDLRRAVFPHEPLHQSCQRKLGHDVALVPEFRPVLVVDDTEATAVRTVDELDDLGLLGGIQGEEPLVVPGRGRSLVGPEIQAVERGHGQKC